MAKKILLILILIILFAIVGIIVNLASSGTNHLDTSDGVDEATNSKPNYDFPIDSRSFLIGTAGYIPANFNDPGVGDVINFWDDTDTSSEVYGIHTNWNDTRLIQTASKNTEADLVVLLGMQTPGDWEKVEDIKLVIKENLDNYSQIKYLGVGNEINLIEEAYPSEFFEFRQALLDISDYMRQNYPDIAFFTTFNYETIIGNGYLTGKADLRGSRLDLALELQESVDLVVFTSYPFLDYSSASSMPDNYYEPLLGFSKPVAFSEIGWLTRDNYFGSSQFLIDNGYSGSENEQVEFLNRFLVLTQKLNLEFVNWAFLHDYADWRNEPVSDISDTQLFDSVGLKNYDDSSKKIWDVWLELRKVKRK